MNGCWNYREIEHLYPILGIAIDKDKDTDELILTAEIIKPSAGESSAEFISQLYESRGNTMIEAMRNLIIKAGQDVYWSHLNIIVVSKEIAEEGLNRVFDMLYRDEEIRGSLFVLVSKEKTAKEIFEKGHRQEVIRADQLTFALKNQKRVGKYPRSKLYEFISNLAYKDSTVLITAVKIMTYPDKIQPEVDGSGIIKYDKLVGFLNDDETQFALMVRDELKGGILVIRDVLDTNNNIALRIFRSKANLKPTYKGNTISMKVNINPIVNLAEISGELQFNDEDTKKKIQEYSQQVLEKQVKYIIRKAQTEYNSDIFKFGEKIRVDNPKLWKEIEPIWSSKFSEVAVEVKVDLLIRGSSLLSKPLKEGDKN